MRILYAIQGTGNGHLSRARDVIPALQKRAEVDILISGIQADVELPYEVNYRYKGMSFIFGKKGGVDLIETWKKNHVRIIFREIRKCPVRDYDLVVNDFEPISAWACRMKGVPCISLSHQAALWSSKVPKPDHRDWMGHSILKHYAPTKKYYGFHFSRFDKNIYTPVVRQEIRDQEIDDHGHYTVYLPAYSDKKLINVLRLIPKAHWEVFSKHSKEAYRIENVHIRPINNEAFIESMASSTGVLCGAGFETPAEALFLNKKLMVIPMKSQYEQHFNAAALKEMGVPILKKLKPKHLKKITKWVKSSARVKVYFPNQTQHVVDTLIEDFIKENYKVSSFSVEHSTTEH